MAKNTYRKPVNERRTSEKPSLKLNFSFLKDRRLKLVFGLLLIVLSVYLLVAFFSYLFTGKADQSVAESFLETGVRAAGAETENKLGLFGALTAHLFIFKWFGLGSFLLPPLLFLWGYRITFRESLYNLSKAAWFCLFFTLWTTVFLGYITLATGSETSLGFFCGATGYEVASLLNGLLGWGTGIFLLFVLGIFFIFFFNINRLGKVRVSEDISEENAENTLRDVPQDISDKETVFNEDIFAESELQTLSSSEERQHEEASLEFEIPSNIKKNGTPKVEAYPEFTVENSEQLEANTEQSVRKDTFLEESEPVLIDTAPYDPTLDLSSYKYPALDLLNAHDGSRAQVTKEELEANKNKIVDTLANYSIGITSIKATIGPTVTLYEIVPDAGIRISKIKSLEDDIALSLSALGIRIIAPIPGRGTIGIEVPNKNREMVSVRSVLSSDKFTGSDKELPVALGKTISNEVFVIDLAKMPHLLMAGATGQGKSVGLNILLSSLIYKKHPSQLKFVLVDPKKVELTLFNKLERHFLAKLPGTEEAIITDTKKVINTLNSLCIEMDVRYDLLKDAGCRNLKEYNQKFIERKLNPKEGHRFLPYIVLVIDELADLMMTAGKEVETPIARLAQLARAIGIHLVLATQRPSVNVITGIIKANFPARLSFKVASKIDSRTILDTGGADQLIGQGDMLLSTGGTDIIRLQCAFIDTPEVDRVCDYIGSQRGYESAYMLPEYIDDDSAESKDFDFSDRDPMFEEAARVIVAHRQGSTSLIQRKLSLGYNRAGRIMDQLEAAGVVGPFEGSKARQVLIPDEYSLEQFLNELTSK